MRAFIVRPFGTKNGIDFERVERRLIGPALRDLAISGRTTAEIVEQGNIRTDMFQRLLTADLVIADLSIHNANVFYELGIRHALRDKRTLLIRCSGDAVPFDLKTDRYLSYDKDHPEASLERLKAALQATIDSEDRDSPVFQLLPELEPPARSRFLVVPRDFREEVERARKEGWAGDLRLLGSEIRALGFDWEAAGLRLVGKALLNRQAFSEAREVWEDLRALEPDDLEACSVLGTVYRRLGDLTRSEAALARALASSEVTPAQLAELHALRGSNAKDRWRADWSPLPAPEERRRAALLSPFLRRSLEAYGQGFSVNLNHYYSGLNALALITIQTELAEGLPEVWRESCESDRKAAADLDELLDQRDKLDSALALSLQAAQQGAQRDPWLEMSLAVHAFLTSDRAGWVARRYREAFAEASPMVLSTEREQLDLYRQLDILDDKTLAVGAVIDEMLERAAEPAEPAADVVPLTLVFTGHRMDAPGRGAERFPAAAEPAARKMIQDAVQEELQGAEGPVVGMAGGASGGDILFHEVCGDLGVATRLLLPVPDDAFIESSVYAAGADWVARFHRLRDRLPGRLLGESRDLPAWLRSGSAAADGSYSLWRRFNLWLLYNALVHGPRRVALIALWDCSGGDGEGGSRDMVERARELGVRTVILDAGRLQSRGVEPIL